MLATVLFDQAEFLYGQQADLKTYTSIRDRAFSMYRKAADLYVAALPGLKLNQQTVEVFRQWFRSSLGASDLAYLTRQDAPKRDQTDQISAALRGLDRELAERHLKLFGEGLSNSMDEVPAHLKPWYLREGLRVLGEHSSGEAARERLRYYDELLTEIELHTAVDGRAEVGHNQPFGVHLSIRNTTAVGRESGGFAHLLQKSYVPSTGGKLNYRERLEKELREKLSESFEIETICLHDPNVMPRGFGRNRWRETPLAYLVLRSNDPSVDRIPAVQLDLEFSDGGGVVLLPIASQVVLIDARDSERAARPVSGIKIKQLLDDRPFTAGKQLVQLEITAVGKGLIPNLDELLSFSDGQIPGFTVGKVEDHGLDVTALDTTSETICPVCRRSWMVDLLPSSETPVESFAFPPVQDASIEVSFERYDDAEIIETADVVGLKGPAGRNAVWFRVFVGIAILLIAIVAIVTVRRFRRRNVETEDARYRRPAELTPFYLLALLSHIQVDESLRLDDTERSSLNRTMDEIEQRFFGRETNFANPSDLETIVDQWLARSTIERVPR